MKHHGVTESEARFLPRVTEIAVRIEKSGFIGDLIYPFIAAL